MKALKTGSRHLLLGCFILLSAVVMLQCSSKAYEERSQESADAIGQKLDSLYQLRDRIDQEIRRLEQMLGQRTAETKAELVEVVEVLPQKFQHHLTVMGEIVSNKDVAISPRITGVVTRVYVQEGQSVSAGQLLAELDGALIRKQIAQVETSLQFARTVYERQKRLWEQRAGSEIQYLEAENRVRTLEQQLAVLQEQLEMTKIKAPFSGVIDKVNIKVGEIAAVGMPALHLVRLADFQVVVEVSERYASAFRVGDLARVSIPDIGKSYTLPIAAISRSVDPKDRTVQIYLKFPKIPKDIRSRMLAVVTLTDYENDSALVVPLRAIQRFEDETFLFEAVQDENNQYVVRKRIVTVGYVENGMAEIKEGLEPGARVIVRGLQNIADGDRISIQ